MSLHLFVIAKDGTCAPLGAFIDRHEARPVFARSGAVAGIYTLDNGVVLSTVAEPSDAQLRALKSFALSVLTGTAPTQPAPAPPPAPKRAKVLRDVAARAARLDDENARLRVVRAELAHVEPDEGEPDALGVDATTEAPPAVVVPAPRYDEVFVAGTAWLDAQAEAPLPVAWEPPVVEAPRCGTTHHADCDCQRDARGEPRADATSEPPRRRSVIEAMREQYEHDCALPDDPSAPELERVRALLVDETAARAAAVEQGAALAADVASLRSELAETVRARDLALAMVTLRQRDCDARDGLIVTLRAALDVERAALAAAREHAARIEAERDGLAASLRERSAQVDALRRAPRAKPVPVRKAPPAAPAPAPAHPVAAIRAALARRAAR